MYGINQYGAFAYSSNTPTDEDIELHSPNLMEYLPSYYEKSNIMINLQNAIARELGKINYFREDAINQLFVDTATWGLTLWEKELNLKTDISKTYEARREIIKARIIGTGAVTKQMLKDTALAYTNAEVEVIENPADYSFILKFIGVRGIPKNMAGLIETIEDIKPAHLSYSFQYVYTWWSNISGLTWANVSQKTWDDLKIYEGV